MFPRSRLFLKGFWKIYWRRHEQPRPVMRFPKAMDAMFAAPKTEEEHKIHAFTATHDAERTTSTEQALIKQPKRQAGAELSFITKVCGPTWCLVWPMLAIRGSPDNSHVQGCVASVSPKTPRYQPPNVRPSCSGALRWPAQ